MSDTIEQITKKLQNALKISGFNVRRDFCKLIIEKLQESNITLTNNQQFETYITKICTTLEKLCENNKSIQLDQIERVIDVCLNHGHNKEETLFSVINAFETPKFSYNDNLQLRVENKTKLTLLGTPASKIKLFNDRYQHVLQRTQRNINKLKNTENSFELQTLDCLLTKSSGNSDRTLYLGALYEGYPGQYHLEDPTGFIPLDLTHAKYHGGFFVNNSFVLMHGHYHNDVFQVSTMTLPPGEEYEQSKSILGHLNYFTNNCKTHLRESEVLKEQLHKNQDRYLYFFSDVWLDNPMTIKKLESILEGLQINPPIALVFIGSFSSESYDIKNIENMKGNFTKLGQLINNYPTIVSSTHFVFVPGPLDPHLSCVLPRLPLPKYITEGFTKLVQNATFTTNPCRIQYCNREIVIYCINLLGKFLENTLHKPPRTDMPDNIARTIISQGHLVPFALKTVPIYWDYDYALTVHPLPNLIVVGDHAESYTSSYKGCNFTSSGSFTKNGYQFKGYNPFTNTIEDCEI